MSGSGVFGDGFLRGEEDVGEDVEEDVPLGGLFDVVSMFNPLNPWHTMENLAFPSLGCFVMGYCVIGVLHFYSFKFGQFWSYFIRFGYRLVGSFVDVSSTFLGRVFDDSLEVAFGVGNDSTMRFEVVVVISSIIDLFKVDCAISLALGPIKVDS
ncbi:hypothetical protein SUGI_0873530 [Cryptomeria japonica]|nr:hypothetical protein SUGI_0873420 [Cryptomeria japonica]GLJ42185.1 hypothetical protein SUGI_0873470 [Cryptomeria japonica]GLJ42190.1 hypothetical protein SUGI_0873530 [Cryptomeria japonica]